MDKDDDAPTRRTNLVDDKEKKKNRKEEGRRLKRMKIEESGGIRPRGRKNEEQHEQEVEGKEGKSSQKRDEMKDPSPPQQQDQQHVDSMRKSNSNSSNNNSYKKSGGIGNNNNNNNKAMMKYPRHQQQQQQNQHRFGRVMDVVPCRKQSRYWTLSIAIPGSILSNCQTRELKTHMIGQIARSCTIYHVDEIIVYDDQLSTNNQNNNRRNNNNRFSRHSSSRDNYNKRPRKDNDDEDDEGQDDEEKKEGNRDRYTRNDNTFMARILQYCECPQYLRKHFFPMHPDLQFVGILPPMDAPHHVRAYDVCKYREGVIIEEDEKMKKKRLLMMRQNKTTTMTGSLVNCGIRGQPVQIDTQLQPGIRCTVELDLSSYPSTMNSNRNPKQSSSSPSSSTTMVLGKLVSPAKPREEDGTYWGYTTRMAKSLQDVFDGCPYQEDEDDDDFSTNGGYDLKIGTSERGHTIVGESLSKNDHPNNNNNNNNNMKLTSSFSHALIVFGGVAGIEECVDADETMKLPGTSSHKLFDHWVNVCAYQGSRTIRTEEAVLIGLSQLTPLLFTVQQQYGSKNDDDKKRRRRQQEQEQKQDEDNKAPKEESTPTMQFSDEDPSDESSTSGDSGDSSSEEEEEEDDDEEE